MAHGLSLLSGLGQALFSAGPGVLTFLREPHTYENIMTNVSLLPWPLPRFLQVSRAEDEAVDGSSLRRTRQY